MKKQIVMEGVFHMSFIQDSYALAAETLKKNSQKETWMLFTVPQRKKPKIESFL